jgi:hypothetical protein
MWSSGVICRVEIDTGILSTCFTKTHDLKLAALHMLTLININYKCIIPYDV